MKNEDMEKENEIKTMVPTLRFSEFREQTGWEVRLLSDILDYERPDNFIVETETYCEGDIPVLTANKSFILGYTRESTGIYVNLPVIIFDDFTTDKKYVDFPFKVKSSAIKILHTKHTDILRFIYELMNQITFEAKEHKRYYISTYQRIQVPLPKEKEQQKIADCLSSLDELIEATTQKVEVLKEHKKGLMQRLFPAGGKNVPDLRFPEFQETSAWEEKRLGDVVEIKGRIGFRGYTTKDIVEQGDGAISLSPTNITDNGNLNFEKSTYISWEKYEESPEIQLKKGYIVLVKTGSSYGKSALVKELPTKTTVNPQIVVLKPKDGINEHFISALISHSMVQRQIKCAVVGGAIPTLSQDSISKFDILYPRRTSHTLSEQRKIANCLSSLDELIEATSRKVEILKDHKKGLIQQLFPKI